MVYVPIIAPTLPVGGCLVVVCDWGVFDMLVQVSGLHIICKSMNINEVDIVSR